MQQQRISPKHFGANRVQQHALLLMELLKQPWEVLPH
jgi:hypothetical protein